MARLTIKDIRNSNKFECEINISESYARKTDIDEWGCAFVWLNNIGVEFNFCKQSRLNCSAIYPVAYNADEDVMETDYCSWMKHHINFKHDNWKEELIDAMCRAMIKLYGTETILKEII